MTVASRFGSLKCEWLQGSRMEGEYQGVEGDRAVLGDLDLREGELTLSGRNCQKLNCVQWGNSRDQGDYHTCGNSRNTGDHFTRDGAYMRKDSIKYGIKTGKLGDTSPWVNIKPSNRGNRDRSTRSNLIIRTDTGE